MMEPIALTIERNGRDIGEHEWKATVTMGTISVAAFGNTPKKARAQLVFEMNKRFKALIEAVHEQ